MASSAPFVIHNFEIIGCAAYILLFAILATSTLKRRRTLSKWLKEKRYAAEQTAGMPALSVIVCTEHGDSEALEKNISAIMGQDYPDFEVIVVNADESDDISDSLTRLTARFPHLRATFIPGSAANVSKRKLAITLGVKAAKNDTVLITSAVCTPPGDKWLAAMARHFGADADIVIGYSRNCHSSDRKAGHRYRAFDGVTESAHYLAAAVRGRTFRGNGNNIAYRKHLFFDNKGFSSTLNMKYGDDDIFVSEIAGHGNVAAEFSPESILTESHHDFSRRFKLDKERRIFTQKRVRSGAAAAAALTTAYYLFTALTVTAFAYSAILFAESGELLKSAAVAGLAAAAWLGNELIYILSYRRTAKLLQAPRLFFCLPPFRFVRPLANAMFRMLASRAGNFTWE